METLVARRSRSVTHGAILGGLDDFIVTLVAQLPLLRREHFRIRAAMGVVAVGAVILCGIVNILRVRNHLRDLFVTPCAQLRPSGDEEASVVRSVGVVAHVARAEGGGAMLIFILHDVFVVTGEAELSEILAVDVQEQRFDLPCVWIVAVHAVILGRLVHDPRFAHLRAESFVTPQTELARIISLEGVEIALGLVAALALARRRQIGPVQVGRLGSRGMTAGVHARSG